jgi:pimeloyl-ACP methyl ester carboxylesterase
MLDCEACAKTSALTAGPLSAIPLEPSSRCGMRHCNPSACAPSAQCRRSSSPGGHHSPCAISGCPLRCCCGWLADCRRPFPARWHTISRRLGCRTLFHTVELMRGWNPQEVAIAPRVPVVFIVGDEDAAASRALSAAPHVDARFLPNTGHFPLWKNREAFMRVLRQVLALHAA